VAFNIICGYEPNNARSLIESTHAWYIGVNPDIRPGGGGLGTTVGLAFPLGVDDRCGLDLLPN